MTIFHVLRVSPFLGLALCVCLVTIAWCLVVLRRGLHYKVDRWLMAFIGLLAVYHGLQILRTAGLLQLAHSQRLDDAVELVVPALYLGAGILLKTSSRHRVGIMFQLRLAEAAPAGFQTPPSSIPADEPFGPRAQVEMLRSALTSLSDNAFKVYTYIWLNADRTTGLLNGKENDLMRALSKSRSALLSAEHELISSGVCNVRLMEPRSTAETPGGRAIWRQAQTLCSTLKIRKPAGSDAPRPA